MTLEDLKIGVSKMSTEQLMATILELRASRRLRKEKPAVKKSASKAFDSMGKDIAALSSAQKQKLLELLGG